MRIQLDSKTALARRVITVLTCLAILVVPQAPAVAAPGCKSRACRDGPPTIEGIPSGQVTAGQTYSFTPTATDPEGKSLSFSIVNRPVWLNFNSSTGNLSGLPAASAVGEYIDISIQASDGRSTATLGPFSITVRDANRAPMIGGAPPTAAREGQFFEFTPTASDADGDALTFRISNRPAWASFNSATGRLAGTPGVGTVGTFANITISVSDGTLGASLSPFSIVVQQVSSGSATLSWLPPTQRTDGSPLTNLAGYRIRYGTAPGNYPNTRQIANPGVTKAVIDNLPAGTYYFVVTAYDTSGGESDFSAVVSKPIS